MKTIIINIIKGIFIGIANIIPGVSGATVALILGVYKEAINVITKFDLTFFQLIKNMKFQKAQQHISLTFLISITSGIIISFIIMSGLLNFLLKNYPLYTWSYFFGIIMASIPYVAKQTSQWTKKESFLFIIGFITSLCFLFVEPISENRNLAFIFFCGIVGGVGMLVPGLSGSHLLIILGNYKLILVETIQNISFSILNIGKPTAEKIDLFTYITILVIFLLGQTICILLFSRLIKFLISKKKDNTFAILSGFISGSLIYLWPWQNKITTINLENKKFIDYLSYPDFTTNTDLYAIAIMIVGVLTMLVLEKCGKYYENA